MVTDAVFGNASPVMEATEVKARATLLSDCSTPAYIPVVTGFNGATPTAARPRSAAAARISPRRYWLPHWMQRSYGSGPTSMAS